MKNLIYTAFVLFFVACSKPVAVEIKDVCSQPAGTEVVIKGYLSLPENIDRTSYRQGNAVSVSYQLFLMTKQDATGDAVRVVLWGSHEAKPNKIKPLPEKYTWNDLIAYTDDGKQSLAGQQVKLTGAVKPNNKGACDVNVTKIENP